MPERSKLYLVKNQGNIPLNTNFLEWIVYIIENVNMQDTEKHPNFNYLDEKTGKYCSEHKFSRMVDLKHRTCEREGCQKHRKFNYIGENPGRLLL